MWQKTQCNITHFPIDLPCNQVILSALLHLVPQADFRRSVHFIPFAMQLHFSNLHELESSAFTGKQFQNGFRSRWSSNPINRKTLFNVYLLQYPAVIYSMRNVRKTLKTSSPNSSLVILTKHMFVQSQHRVVVGATRLLPSLRKVTDIWIIRWYQLMLASTLTASHPAVEACDEWSIIRVSASTCEHFNSGTSSTCPVARL